MGMNVDGQNVAGAAGVRLGDDKTGNLRGAVLRHLRHQRERAAAAHVPGQFTARICDPGRETGLIDAPELIEILGAAAADRDHVEDFSRLHSFGVLAYAACFPAPTSSAIMAMVSRLNA